MQSLEGVCSKELVEEIGRRFFERETTIAEMNVMMEQMERMNKKLLVAEENKSKFMSIIKNEFNNPLGSMISLSKTLLLRSEEKEVQFIGSTIHEEALLLNFQIHNIIIATEIESGTLDREVSQVDVAAVLERVEESLTYPMKNKSAQIRTQIDMNSVFGVDSDKLYLILVNLVSNAIEFSAMDAVVEVKISEEEDHFVLLVRDYGEGIEEEEKQNVYERFYQAHSGMNRAHRGQGLGLSVVKELVVFLGGEIEFESTIGVSTCFKIVLPKLSLEESFFDDDCMFCDFDQGQF